MAARRQVEPPGGPDRVHLRIRPERHAALRRPERRRIGDPRRDVPGQAGDVVAEKRSVVAETREAALAGVLQAGAELSRPVIDRHRQLGRDHAANPEAAAPGGGAGLLRVPEGQAQIDVGGCAVGQRDARDVAPCAQVEQRRAAERARQGQRLALDAGLHAVVQRQLAGDRRVVERARVLAVEERDLVPFDIGLEPAEVLIRRGVALIAIADIVGLQPVARPVAVLRHAEAIDRAAVADVAVALEARLVRAGP